MQIKRIAMGGLAVMLWGASAAAAPPIDRLAPDSTVLFLTVDDAERTLERFHRTSLAKLMEGPAPAVSDLQKKEKSSARSKKEGKKKMK